MAATSVEDTCLKVALEQHGVITATQAIELGLTMSAIQRRVRSRRWVPIHRGVYRLREVQPTWEQALMAACAWGGPNTAASHRAAARLLGLGVEQAPTEIVLGGVGKKPPPSIRLHRTDALAACDLARVKNIP